MDSSMSSRKFTSYTSSNSSKKEDISKELERANFSKCWFRGEEVLGTVYSCIPPIIELKRMHVIHSGKGVMCAFGNQKNLTCSLYSGYRVFNLPFGSTRALRKTETKDIIESAFINKQGYLEENYSSGFTIKFNINILTLRDLPTSCPIQLRNLLLGKGGCKIYICDKNKYNVGKISFSSSNEKIKYSSSDDNKWWELEKHENKFGKGVYICDQNKCFSSGRHVQSYNSASVVTIV